MFHVKQLFFMLEIETLYKSNMDFVLLHKMNIKKTALHSLFITNGRKEKHCSLFF